MPVDMDLNLIRSFVEVVDARSLSEAARRRDVTRSKVSKELKALEAALGTRLLHRSTRSAALTEAGQILYQRGRNVIEQVDAARGSIDALQHVVTGIVRLSIPTGLGEQYLARMLLEFHQLHPQVHIRVLFSNRVSDLMGADIDIAVRVASEVHDLVARELGSIESALYASRDFASAHPFATPGDIPYGMLLTPPGDGKCYAIGLVSQQGQTLHLKCEPYVTSEHFPFLKQSMLMGCGVAALPQYMVIDELRAGTVQRVCPDWKVTGLGDKLYIITMANRRPPHAVTVMTQFLQQHLRRFVT